MNSVEKIASSNGSTFFITNDNDVFVIGHNNYGECGTGNRESVRGISKIEEIPKAIDIKVRISRSFLLSKDFDVYSCGMNFNRFWTRSPPLSQCISGGMNCFFCSKIKK